MLTQGFKNLIKSSTFIDQSFQQLLKKSDEYRKSSKMSLDFLQNMYKLYETHEIAFYRFFLQANSELNQKKEKHGMDNRYIVSVFQRVFNTQNGFGKKFGNNIKEAIEMSSDLFNNYSNQIATFQSAIRSYIKNQQTLLQQSKRYFKNQKALLQSLESYKESFTDVKLIYNMDEKVKRYMNCESIYKSMMDELKNIEQRLTLTNKLKRQIAENYKNIEYEFTSAIKIVGNRIITLAEVFVFEYKEMFGALSSFLREQSSETIKIKGSLSFSSEDSIKNEDLNENVKQNAKYPYFIVFFANMKIMKPQFLPQVARLFNSFMKQVSQKIQNRKRSQRFLMDFIANYFKQHEKIVINCMRDLNSSYEKYKKKISEIYGNQHMKFMKTFSIVFQKIIDNGQVLIKSISLRLKTIENVVQQSARNMDGFLKESKMCFERSLKKKQSKKSTEQELGEGQSLRLQMQEKSIQLQALIDSLLLKLNQTEAQLNIHCNSIINDMLGNSLQLSQFCRQLQEDEFEQSIFAAKYQVFQVEVEEMLKTKITLFSDLSFASLLSEKDELITFEPELNKIEEFKKIKKPAEYEILKETPKKRQVFDEKINDLQKKPSQTPKKVSTQQLQSPEKSLEKLEKYEQFLLSKIALQDGQRYCKSFACGLSDKIILTGRLFVTTQRLCFHSKFNPNNVFFGDTFIQIPKKDILKVEKRLNAIIFNNSISVTTINGEMFFTSFFSRNEAYDSICQSLEINNNEELMFELEDQNPQIQEEIEEIKQDDMKAEDLSKRTADIDAMLDHFEYIEIHVSEYTYPGLNAYKFFKLFESNTEITYNRKTFKGFNLYFKDLIQHKDIIVEDWSPNLAEFLNPTNIKQGCPLNFDRVSTCIIPVANSGIPLMPKQAHLREEAKLHFYSKDKYVIVTKVQNSGIPYCDYFNIRYKKVVETINDGISPYNSEKCRLSLYYYIEFVQKTMMRSVIQSKSIEQSKLMTGKLEVEMKKYLKHLEKMKIRVNPNAQSQENLDEKINELQKEIQESKERQQKLEKQAIVDRQRINRFKKMLGVSVLMNLLLVLIIISLY